MQAIWSWIYRLVPGLISSLTVGLILWSIAVLRKRWALRQMEGHWLVIEDTPPRYSLGVLRFSFWTKRHRYDGYKYTNDGEHSLRWDTVEAYFDADHMKFLYIYEVTHFDKGSKINHGFGQIIIPNRGIPSGLGETNGFFVDAETANSDMHQVRLFRAEEVAKSKELLILFNPEDEVSRKNFIAQLARTNWPS